MKIRLILFLLISVLALSLNSISQEKKKTGSSYEEDGKRYWQAAMVELDAVELPKDARRVKLLRAATELRKNSAWLKYRYGKAHPKDGGFDCSGAVYYVLRGVGMKHCPRTSAAQYDWVKKLGNLKVAPEGKGYTLQDAYFDDLKPGDLLFWGKTYKPIDGRTNGVTHVEIYLGREKVDGHHVMIGSSKGRSYRRKRSDGYGVVDFKLPSERTKTVFMGYGSPDFTQVKMEKSKKKAATPCDCQ